MAKWRDWMNNNSAIVTIAAVVVLMMALAAIVYQAKGPGSGSTLFDVYYYDLDTGKVFTAKNTEMAPIAAPSGADKGVKAYMFGCNDCSEKNRFVGYLERYTAKAKDQILKAREAAKNAAPGSAPPMMDAVYEMGLEIADPAEKKWVPQMSEAGRKIMEKIEGKCKSGDKLLPCLPGR